MRLKEINSWICSSCNSTGTSKKILRRCPACGKKTITNQIQKVKWNNER